MPQESHKQNQAEEEGDIDGQIDKELEEEARATELLRLVEEKVSRIFLIAIQLVSDVRFGFNLKQHD